MTRKIMARKDRFFKKCLVISSLGLVFCFGAWQVSAQQNQPGEVNATPMQQEQQDPQAQGAPNQGLQQNSQALGAPDQEMQQGPPEMAAPRTLTLPAGTVIRVRVNQWISSDRNLPGDGFSAVLDQPIVVDGWVVARRGQSETGRVSMAIKARGNGKSQLGLELNDLTFVDGQQLPIQTQLLQSSSATSNGHNAAVIGTTTGIGAAIGAVTNGGPGAAIGAIVGGAAGVVGVFSTPGKPTVIFPESVLSFRLQSPIEISTEKSQVAFQPVTQADYDSQTANGRQNPGATGDPGNSPQPLTYSVPYAYGYPYGYGYGYPYAFGYYPAPFGFGIYGGGYGFGPWYGGYGGGFRGGFGGGGRGGGRR